MIRLFTAIELPEPLRARLAALCVGIDGARWVPPENLHLTLRFIGEIDEGVAHDVVDALDRITAPGFPLTLAGAGHFESGRKVRSLWVGIERNDALVLLQTRIESALKRAGLPPDARRFTPHVTLARLNNGAREPVARWLAANSLFRALPFTVERFALYSSFLGRSGSIYRIEETFPLGQERVS